MSASSDALSNGITTDWRGNRRRNESMAGVAEGSRVACTANLNNSTGEVEDEYKRKAAALYASSSSLSEAEGNNIAASQASRVGRAGRVRLLRGRGVLWHMILRIGV